MSRVFIGVSEREKGVPKTYGYNAANCRVRVAERGRMLAERVAVWLRLCLTACLCLGLLACDTPVSGDSGPRYLDAPPVRKKNLYRLAVHPLHNPQKLSESYQPLIDYLNRRLPEARFELEASRNYQAYEEKIRARTPEILLPNPWQSLQAMDSGYGVIAMAGDAEDFYGIFIVRKDSELKHPRDLRGKAIAYPSPTALAAAMLPQFYLHRQGVDIATELDNRYVGSQESSIMSVFLNETAIAATWPPPWRAFQKDHPQEAAQLRVIWQTPPLLNNSLMLRDDVPVEIRRKLQTALLDLTDSREGMDILAAMQTARFHRADNAFYEPVRDFIRRFEREVRPVAQP
ncbi:MAG: phosphate/phosphite/phosphonate ABC transporter substrate-binding protein [Azonexus sp.]|nr:phosphate/phosphite/phosphonate ABC transporter substrate-binding protein [Azonexus sp.]MCK6412107.1 phosphate/phosphite/phosphonate ABC transporter substrate-binding protein [Azonexus sp.]